MADADNTYAKALRDDIPTINAQTGTSYTFALTDAAPNAFTTLSNGSAIAATVPPNADVAFPLGSVIKGAQIGAGLVTITAGSGVTISVDATFTLALGGQYSQFELRKIATNTWLITGDLAAA